MPKTIPAFEIQDAIGDMVDAVNIIPVILQQAGESGGAGAGLDARECDQLGVILGGFTHELNRRFVALFDETPTS